MRLMIPSLNDMITLPAGSEENDDDDGGEGPEE